MAEASQAPVGEVDPDVRDVGGETEAPAAPVGENIIADVRKVVGVAEASEAHIGEDLPNVREVEGGAKAPEAPEGEDRLGDTGHLELILSSA